MTSFATDQLPTPSAVEYDDGTAFHVSSGYQSGKPLHVRVPDPAVDPRRFVLVYTTKPKAVLSSLRDHFESYVAKSFDWTPPGETVALRVIHVEPPQLRWRNPITGDARVFLEEALAH